MRSWSAWWLAVPPAPCRSGSRPGDRTSRPPGDYLGLAPDGGGCRAGGHWWPGWPTGAAWARRRAGRGRQRGFTTGLATAASVGAVAFVALAILAAAALWHVRLAARPSLTRPTRLSALAERIQGAVPAVDPDPKEAPVQA